PLKLLPLPVAPLPASLLPKPSAPPPPPPPPLPVVPLGAKHHPPACAHASLPRSNRRSTPSTAPLVALLHQDRFPLSKGCVGAPSQAAPSPPSPPLLLRPPLLRSSYHRCCGLPSHAPPAQIILPGQKGTTRPSRNRRCCRLHRCCRSGHR
ncbi:unnamed protein product, partial [Ectocarpus sp. 8 AP-2014]